MARILDRTLGRRHLRRGNEPGLRDRGWLDVRTAHPHSDALRRDGAFSPPQRRSDGSSKVTIDDPKALSLKPWTPRPTLLPLMADTELLEAFCDGHEQDHGASAYRGATAGAAQPGAPLTHRALCV